jgi:3-methyladenine DNA glycosylase/8-oxoguanine DNA glycosylase
MSDDVDIEAYLSGKDPQLGRLIKVVRPQQGSPMRPAPTHETPFEALVRAVIYQRGSESAGSTVYSRLEEITGRKLTPNKITARRRLDLPQFQLFVVLQLHALAPLIAANGKLEQIAQAAGPEVCRMQPNDTGDGA